jgi:hypothetical protein
VPLENADPLIVVRQPDARRQARQAGSDDERVVRQVPNLKHRITNKSQTSMSETRDRSGASRTGAFGFGDLKLVCDLVFVI